MHPPSPPPLLVNQWARKDVWVAILDRIEVVSLVMQRQDYALNVASSAKATVKLRVSPDRREKNHVGDKKDGGSSKNTKRKGRNVKHV